MAKAKPDLYAILGVERTAPTEEIRAAYRAKAKTAHPDAGGDRKVWDELTLAHMVLTNGPTRRAYDESGVIPGFGKDPADEVFGVINDMLLHVIGADDADVANLELVDLVKILKQMAGHASDAAAKNRTATTRLLTRAKTLRGRLELREGDGENPFDEMIERRIEALEHDLLRINRTIEQMKAVTAYLDKNVRYRRDEPPNAAFFVSSATTTY